MCVVPITGSPPMPTAVEKPMSRSSYIIWYVSVPDLETSPIRPSVVMSAGMMPALDLPGDATPGQFGPTMRVWLPLALAYAQNAAVSCTGMPSVMTITSGIPASTASVTAALVPAGGTKTTDTSAPVAAMVSATVPNTGTAALPRSTVCPAFRGFVPPTTVVPAASIRRPCLVPSEPVMPWIMTRLSPVRKIAISCSCRGGSGQFRGTPGCVGHGRDLLDHRQTRVSEDAAALLGVVAVQPDHDRVPDFLALAGQHADRRHDPVGHRVTRGDAAEHVDQDAADRGVGQHDLQAVRHHLGGRAPADVQEVRGPHPAERLPGQGHHVQRGHDQPGPVADDAHLAVEFDVIQVLGLRLGLQRVGRLGVGELRVVLAEGRVVVQADLSVHGEDVALVGQGHGV